MWLLAFMAFGAVCILAAVAVLSSRSPRSTGPAGLPTSGPSQHIGACPICGYDMTGLAAGTCPECGDSDRVRQELRAGTRRQLASIDRVLVRAILVLAIVVGLMLAGGWLLRGA